MSEKINTKLAELGFPNKCVTSRKFPVSHFTCKTQRAEDGSLLFGTGSEIVLFTTDESGRAEGWHPHPDSPASEVTLIVNEAKTVIDPIFDAFGRCTYTNFVCVSSPGRSNGRFYVNYQRSVHHPSQEVPGDWYSRKVTSYDCPHISRQKIEKDKEEWGEGSFLFRSRHLAEFTNLDELCVIKQQDLDKCLEARIEQVSTGLGLHAGIDLALGGGDETTVYVFNENVYYYSACFYCSDPGNMVPLLDTHLINGGLKKGRSIVNCDDGNIGPMVIDGLRKLGWVVNKVLNQSSAINKQSFLNRGAEIYFNFARMIQECVVKLPKNDTTLLNQLANRYYADSGHQGKLFLESKKEAKARGQKSPDRADACVLAFAGYIADDFKNGITTAKFQRQPLNTKTLINANVDMPPAVRAFYEERNRELNRDRSVKSFGFNPGAILRGIYGN